MVVSFIDGGNLSQVTDKLDHINVVDVVYINQTKGLFHLNMHGTPRRLFEKRRPHIVAVSFFSSTGQKPCEQLL
jgi:hypothetical protein